jgi:hypothetical protein
MKHGYGFLLDKTTEQIAWDAHFIAMHSWEVGFVNTNDIEDLLGQHIRAHQSHNSSWIAFPHSHEHIHELHPIRFRRS